MYPAKKNLCNTFLIRIYLNDKYMWLKLDYIFNLFYAPKMPLKFKLCTPFEAFATFSEKGEIITSSRDQPHGNFFFWFHSMGKLL